MEELIAVLLGLFAGTVTGIVPGAGVTVAMVIATPMLMGFDITQLLLFYMALASMVQFTGTIPAVFLGVPGETNSLPAVIEGTKFNRRKMSQLAIGVSAVSSVVGSMVAVVLTFILLSFLISQVSIFFSNTVKFYLYIFIIVFCLFVYNRGKLIINFMLSIIGFVLSIPGEGDISPKIRYTMGIDDLEFGVPLMPVLIGFLIVPTLYKIYNDHQRVKQFKKHDVPFKKVLVYFVRCLPSSIRGSVIGYLCGFVPGVNTILATNTSYSVEKRLNRNSPGRQLVASETANNSGQFASMLPLLLIGIPITGSEVILYSLLVDAGWSPFQFDNVANNADMIFRDIVPWFVFANIVGLLVAWPFAKQILRLFTASKKYIIILIGIFMIGVNTYLGVQDYRTVLYTVCLLVFGCVGLLMRKHEPIPLIFMFILGNDIEAVFFRQLLI
jgi:putative tricarboxylic transport membrane protein